MFAHIFLFSGLVRETSLRDHHHRHRDSQADFQFWPSCDGPASAEDAECRGAKSASFLRTENEQDLAEAAAGPQRENVLRGHGFDADQRFTSRTDVAGG